MKLCLTQQSAISNSKVISQTLSADALGNLAGRPNSSRGDISSSLTRVAISSYLLKFLKLNWLQWFYSILHYCVPICIHDIANIEITATVASNAMRR